MERKKTATGNPNGQLAIPQITVICKIHADFYFDDPLYYNAVEFSIVNLGYENVNKESLSLLGNGYPEFLGAPELPSSMSARAHPAVAVPDALPHALQANLNFVTGPRAPSPSVFSLDFPDLGSAPIRWTCWDNGYNTIPSIEILKPPHSLPSPQRPIPSLTSDPLPGPHSLRFPSFLQS